MLSSTGIQLETIQKSVSFEISFPNNYKSDSLRSCAQKLNYSKTLCNFENFGQQKFLPFISGFAPKQLGQIKKKDDT